MTATVVSRRIRSSPQRDASDTWSVIVDLLTKGTPGPARDELLSVAGVAASIISDEVLEGASVTVSCDGPRTRIYCLYGERAIDGGDATEDSLGYDPLLGDWAISLPCNKDDLEWVRRALAGTSKRITARDAAESFGVSESEEQKTSALKLDVNKFLES